MGFQHLLILLLFPFVYFDIFLTTWMRFPPHVLVLFILVVYYRDHMFASRSQMKYYLFLLVLNVLYSIFYIGDLAEFTVNTIKLSTIFFTVVYFYSLGKIERLISYCVGLSLVSFLVYLIAFFDFDLNLRVRALVNGVDDGIQDWGGLTKTQFQFGYELIPLIVFLLLKKRVSKLVGFFIIILSPQRSVVSSLLVFLNSKKLTFGILILVSVVFYVFSDVVGTLIQENFEYNVLTKKENSDSDEESRFQMFKEGMNLVAYYPFGSILQNVKWEDAVTTYGMVSFKTGPIILAPHNVLVYTLFIFGILPGTIILYFYLRPLLSGLRFIKHRKALKLTLFISFVLFLNAFFHNACYLTTHSVTLIFYFIYLFVFNEVKQQKENPIFIPDQK